VDGRITANAILDAKTSSRKEEARIMPQTPASAICGHIPRRRLLAGAAAVALAGLSGGDGAQGAEFLLPAPASITAVEAARHTHALADDALEGREGGTRGGRAAAAYVVEQIEPLGFEPAGGDGSYYQSFGSGLRNVLAFLPGSDPLLAQEVVVIGAHYDHVGYGTAQNSFGPFGFVHNGADDNASGVAGLIEIMEAVHRLPGPPRRSILFAFWDGEEKGLLGSRHFLRVRPPLLAGRRLVFCLNLDMIGRLRERRLIVFGSRTATGMRSLIVAANNRSGRGSGLELAFDWDLSEDSDHYAFVEAGVPSAMLHTGLHDQYHRPSDDVEHLNHDGIPPVARLGLEVATDVANSETTPAFRADSRRESNVARKRFETERPRPRPSRGRWGILSRTDPADPALPLVLDIAAGSPAERGGLEPGDRLLAIDGEPITDQAGMVQRLASVDRECTLEVERRGLVVLIQLRDED
jgi:hypothetical protein